MDLIIFRSIRVLYILILWGVSELLFHGGSRIPGWNWIFPPLLVIIAVTAERFFPKLSLSIFRGILKSAPRLTEKLSKNHWSRVTENNYKSNHSDRYEDSMALLRTDFLLKLSPDSVVADIGCGDGWFIREVAPFCRRADGYDFSESLLGVATEHSRNFPNVRYQVFDIRHEALPEKYAFLALQGVLFCFITDTDAAAVIENVRKSRAPNGILCIRDALLPDCPEPEVIPEIGGIYRGIEQYRSLWKQAGIELPPGRPVGKPYWYNGKKIQNYLFFINN